MNKKVLTILSILIIGLLIISACAPAIAPVEEAPAEETVEEVAEEVVEEKPPLGSAERPIKVLFVPSLEVGVLLTGGEEMAVTLTEMTGLEFEVSVPTSYPATIEEMCASPDDTMSFLPGFGYVLGEELCGLQVHMMAERYGGYGYYAAFIVRRDSGIESLEDLEGKSWGYGEATSTSGFVFPTGWLYKFGVTPGEEVQTGGHPQTAAAVYNGEVDFGTVFFTPPGLPEGEWKEGDEPDIPDDLLETCVVDEALETFMCSGYEVRDARSTLRTVDPKAMEQVGVLELTSIIPNDTLSFGPDFDKEVIDQIVAAMIEYAKSEEFTTTLGKKDFYGWTGVGLASDADYDLVRAAAQAAGMTLETLD